MDVSMDSYYLMLTIMFCSALDIKFVRLKYHNPHLTKRLEDE